MNDRDARDAHPASRASRAFHFLDPVPRLTEWCPRCLTPSLLEKRVIVTDGMNPTAVHKHGWRIECFDCSFCREELDIERPFPEVLPT